VGAGPPPFHTEKPDRGPDSGSAAGSEADSGRLKLVVNVARGRGYGGYSGSGRGGTTGPPRSPSGLSQQQRSAPSPPLAFEGGSSLSPRSAPLPKPSHRPAPAKPNYPPPTGSRSGSPHSAAAYSTSPAPPQRTASPSHQQSSTASQNASCNRPASPQRSNVEPRNTRPIPRTPSGLAHTQVTRYASSPEISRDSGGSLRPHTPTAIAGGDTSLRGSLLKLGDKGPVKSWKRRYFLQKSEKLFYYASSNTGGDAKGFIDLIQHEFRIIPDASFDHKGYGFQICVKGRIYCLIADSEQERERWVTGLQQYRAEGAILRMSAPSSNGDGTPSPHTSVMDPDSARLTSELLQSGFALLPGEQVSWQLRQAFLIDQWKGKIQGSVIVTNFRLLFWINRADLSVVVFDVPLTMVRKSHRSFDVKKTSAKSLARVKSSDRLVDLTCKDMRKCRLSFLAKTQTRRKFSEMFSIYSPASIQAVFAFIFKAQLDVEDHQWAVDGWTVYNELEELSRLGIENDHMWRVTTLNTHFQLCDSYPQHLAVPASISDDELNVVAAFRSRGRLPALTWIHPVTRAALTRCSQPRVGLSMKSSQQDERMIRTLGGRTAQLWVMDARPRAAAVANTARGAGYESSMVYKGIRVRFLGIGNIHVMRNSQLKLFDHLDAKSSDEGFFSSVSSWLGHLKNILYGARKIAKLLERGENVLIHCSDGWDRTPQLSSLAQIFLDPFYRTLRGLCILIEKDWCSFGHKFLERCGHLIQSSDSEQSPVFVQFMDCLWQMQQQFPKSFEFNETLLFFLCDQVYACQYGTFLCNNNFERERERVRGRTISVWSEVLSNPDRFLNPAFVPYDVAQDPKLSLDDPAYGRRARGRVLYPLTSVKSLRFWRDYYFRFRHREQPVVVEE